MQRQKKKEKKWLQGAQKLIFMKHQFICWLANDDNNNEAGSITMSTDSDESVFTCCANLSGVQTA